MNHSICKQQPFHRKSNVLVFFFFLFFKSNHKDVCMQSRYQNKRTPSFYIHFVSNPKFISFHTQTHRGMQTHKYAVCPSKSSMALIHTKASDKTSSQFACKRFWSSKLFHSCSYCYCSCVPDTTLWAHVPLFAEPVKRSTPRSGSPRHLKLTWLPQHCPMSDWLWVLLIKISTVGNTVVGCLWFFSCFIVVLSLG